MDTVLKERVINLEEMMADLIETFRRRDEEWDRKMAEAREEWDRKIAEEREERIKAQEERERKIAKEREEMEKIWGGLMRKSEIVAEYIIEPSIESAIEKRFNTEVIERYAVIKRVKRKLRDQFDLVAVTENGKVFMIEVRSSPKSHDIDDVKKKLVRFKKLFPEYEGKAIIPVFASLYIDDSIIRYATKRGVYVMGMKGEFIEFLN